MTNALQSLENSAHNSRTNLNNTHCDLKVKLKDKLYTPRMSSNNLQEKNPGNVKFNMHKTQAFDFGVNADTINKLDDTYLN